MKFHAIATWLCLTLSALAQDQKPETKSKTNEPLQSIVDKAVEKTVEKFAETKLRPDQIAVTLVRLPDGEQASHRGEISIYPASVVKLFYLEAAHRWMEEGKIQDSEELRRAMKDMIVESYNEATHYVLDVLTGTTSGPELPPGEMEEWSHKRNAVNRYLVSRGFTKLNANQKPWCEGPYGRDRIFVGKTYTNRNALTTSATARLLSEIATAKAVSPKRSAEMMELLKRDPFVKTSDPDDQAHGFSGTAIPAGAKLWSKAGWTSETRHDAAYIELPNGNRLVLVIFTVGHANEREIIPTLARAVLENFGAYPAPK
jgi:hypothetical protein